MNEAILLESLMESKKFSSISQFRLLAVICLILGLVAFTSTSAHELFFPANHSTQGRLIHFHTHEATYCDAMVDSNIHPCLHSVTSFQIYSETRIEKVDRFVHIRCQINPILRSVLLEDYYLRAPPA